MDKICLIRQPAGVGDLFFCQKIAKKIQAETPYKRILWPVNSIYTYVSKYLKADRIEFCDCEKDFEFKNLYLSNVSQIIQNDELLFVPLDTADRVLKTCKCCHLTQAHGHVKFDLCNISYHDWTEYFEFRRDRERERQLIEALNLDLSVPYNLVNKNYGTFPNYLTRDDIKSNNGLRDVYMNFYEGVNLFDWVGIFENATEIHTIETSLCYILRKLNLKNVNVYSRNKMHGEDLIYMKNQYDLDWKYITWENF